VALARGEENIEDKQVRTIALLVLRGVAAWLKRYESNNVRLSTILFSTNSLIRELEQWKV
jgi:hypothetical protein